MPATPLAPTMLGLDEQICFALYRASRSLTARYRELLAPMGLTYPQYLAMLVLWQSEPITVGALGDRLDLDSGTVSPLVRRLEALGLVERKRSGRDERVVHVALTDAGRELRSRAAGIPAEICAATGLAPDDLTALRDEIAGLAHNVRASL